MFDRFTYKQKNYALLGVFVLLSMASYKRSFSLTLAALAEIDNQEDQLVSTQHINEDLESLQIQIVQLNNNIGRSDIEPDLVQQEILGEISDFAIGKDLNLEKLEETHAYQTVDFTIYSNRITVRGSFDHILSLVHHMENNFEFARIINVELEKETNKQNKKELLYATLLFQHFRQN